LPILNPSDFKFIGLLFHLPNHPHLKFIIIAAKFYHEAIVLDQHLHFPMLIPQIRFHVFALVFVKK